MPANRGRAKCEHAIRPIGQPISEAVSAKVKVRTGRANTPPQQDAA